MYFINENTKATTKQDQDILLQVCILLRTSCFLIGQQKKLNPKWDLIRMECHSVARFVSLIMKELTLIDGFIIGLHIKEGETKVSIAHTSHSWLITPDGAIIDPYPMGIISSTSALLIPTSNTRYCIHGANMYHKDSSVQKHFDVSRCWRNARSSLRALKKNFKEKDLKEIISGVI